MNCDLTRKLLADYLEESLSAHQVLEMQEHLAGCSGCARALDELRAVDDLLAQWSPPVPPAAEMWASIQARIASEGLTNTTRSGGSTGGAHIQLNMHWLTMAIVTTALLVGSVMWYINNSHQSVPPPLPKFQESLLQSHSQINRSQDGFNDRSNESRATVRRERGGAGVCH